MNAVIRGQAVLGDNLVPRLVDPAGTGSCFLLPACLLLPPRISLDVRSTNAFFPPILNSKGIAAYFRQHPPVDDDREISFHTC